MSVLVWLILLSLCLGGGALALFLWSLRSGQYDDLDGAANRILFDEAVTQVDTGQRRSPSDPVRLPP